MVPETPDDVWHVYNLIVVDDEVECTTTRKLKKESALESRRDAAGCALYDVVYAGRPDLEMPDEERRVVSFAAGRGESRRQAHASRAMLRNRVRRRGVDYSRERDK